MPKIGDRVLVQGNKVGDSTREGTVIGVVGRLLNVRWADGTTSMFTPGAGAVAFEPRNGAGRPAAAHARTVGAAAGKPAPAKKAAPKKAAPKKPAKKR